MIEKKYSILFVDDEENNLLAFKNAFFRHYHITTSTSALKAADILREHPVQLIITDQRMPQMSGIEFLRVAKEIQPQAIQVIITGYSDLEVIMQAFNELGIFHYALKPWNNQELKIIIDNALQQYQLTQDKELLINQLREANENLEQRVRERTSELEQQTEAYIQLNKLKDKLFSIISHDLRSPLTTISAFMEIFLNSNGELSERDTYELMTDLQASVLNLQEMLENLLSWSRSQMKSAAVRHSTLSLSEIIEKNIKLYQSAADQKQINLTLTLAPKDIKVEAEVNMLHVVLRNLLSNALKFTPSGGKITVATTENGQFASIAVADSGVGMTEDTLQKLFSNEFIVSTYGTAQEKGTGLGLKLCKEFIEQLGGKLSISSTPSQGSIFIFTHPLHS